MVSLIYIIDFGSGTVVSLFHPITQKFTTMETKNSISRGAFSAMMSAFAHFDKVDEGCGYERLKARKMQIQDDFDLTDEELARVEEWAHSKYYLKFKTMKTK